MSAEGSGPVEAFAGEGAPDHDPTMPNMLGAVRFDGGEASRVFLGFVHQHGNWIDWRAPDSP